MARRIPSFPVKDIDAFLTEMRAANVDWQMISYSGAVHSFTNPAAGSDPSTGAALQRGRRSAVLGRHAAISG